MRFLVLFALFCFVLSVTGQDTQCKQFKTPEDCNAGTQNGTSCVWCLCRAVPSSCHTCTQARKLPPGVFVCQFNSNCTQGEM